MFVEKLLHCNLFTTLVKIFEKYQQKSSVLQNLQIQPTALPKKLSEENDRISGWKNIVIFSRCSFIGYINLKFFKEHVTEETLLIEIHDKIHLKIYLRSSNQGCKTQI